MSETQTGHKFVTGHKSVFPHVWHDLLSKFDINKVDRVKLTKNLGRTLLDEMENLFWYILGPPSGCLGWSAPGTGVRYNVRVKTQEVQSYQHQDPEQCVSAPV